MSAPAGCQKTDKRPLVAALLRQAARRNNELTWQLDAAALRLTDSQPVALTDLTALPGEIAKLVEAAALLLQEPEDEAGGLDGQVSA